MSSRRWGEILGNVFFLTPRPPRASEGVSGGVKIIGPALRNFDERCFAVCGRATRTVTGADVGSRTMRKEYIGLNACFMRTSGFGRVLTRLD